MLELNQFTIQLPNRFGIALVVVNIEDRKQQRGEPAVGVMRYERTELTELNRQLSYTQTLLDRALNKYLAKVEVYEERISMLQLRRQVLLEDHLAKGEDK